MEKKKYEAPLLAEIDFAGTEILMASGGYIPDDNEGPIVSPEIDQSLGKVANYD